MRNTIKKITDSFPNYKYDMETTTWDWVIYFWNNENHKFFFELPNGYPTIKVSKGIKVSPKVKIYLNEEWKTFENENVDKLIEKTKEIINIK
ncbi:MAG: hypothetical protein HPY57_16125 [Ignavibacteria bacterium]|nr:hypothetical protein [Ignavibacteria bacterium]